MEPHAKQNPLLKWLFGTPLTGDDLARHLAMRPPHWVRDIVLCLYLLSMALLAAGYLGLLERLPLIGEWLARERTLVVIGCLAIIIALNWYYEGRVEKRRSP